MLWHLHWLDRLLAVGHAVEASSCLDFCHRIIMWVLCSLVFPQVLRRDSENVGLGTAADRTVVVGICKQCDLTDDPRCLYRIWHLPALPPLLCLVHLDSSVLGIGDVVLQRYLTGKNFCTSSQSCPKSRCGWLPDQLHVSWFVFVAIDPLLPSSIASHHTLPWPYSST